MPLRVAVTGPTGEIGISAIEALERHDDVATIVGMARRPFDPTERGWSKTMYRQGDILDRDAVDALVADADVVVHLAYLIMGTRDESRRINLAGTRNVFEATVAAPRPKEVPKLGTEEEGHILAWFSMGMTPRPPFSSFLMR